MRWLLLLAPAAEAAVTVGAFAAEDLVEKLRSSIFVETAFLEERPAQVRCSSLDGPGCLAGLSDGPLDGPGVLPERVLHDLGEGTGHFVTPEYWALEELRRGASGAVPGALLLGDEAKNYLATGRNTTSTGLMHFAGAPLDRRLPVTFSRGLPEHLVATWDGRWIARGSFAAQAHSLPPPGGVILASQTSDLTKPGGPRHQLSVTAELAGSLGYLRFSRPVSVRSLFVQWPTDSGAPRALVAGRLGLESVWNSHLDPQQLESEAWVDIAGDPLAQVDELVFMAAKGLQVGALQIACAEELEAEERTVLMLRPSGEGEPRFALALQRLRADAAPFVASLKEVVDHKLRLRGDAPSRALGAARGEDVPGLLSASSPDDALELTEASLKFRLAAKQNAALFDHGFLMDMAAGEAKNMLAGFAKMPVGILPEDLRRGLSEKMPELSKSLRQHIQNGGWTRSTPLRLPHEGSDEIVKEYIEAKQRQTHFDLLSAALIYVSHNSLAF